MNLKKKIKRAVENNDNVKGINVISSFLERRMNIFVIVFHALDFFFSDSLIKNRIVIKLFIYFLEYLLHKSQRVRYHLKKESSFNHFIAFFVYKNRTINNGVF
jgi:hypothetical protein